jgi:1-acyl-sn-glycerol-3-phosphate acyltransferase
MAKKELKYSPLLGQFMTLSNAVFVNRSRRADAVAVFAKVAETMKQKVVRCASIPFDKFKRHLASTYDLVSLAHDLSIP